MSWHGKLPWRWVQSFHRSVRKTLFTKPKPDAPKIRVAASERELLEAFGTNGYAPNWEFSYNYYGEDLNLARLIYNPQSGHNVNWMQTHVRGWRVDTSTWELMAHYEPEPTEHPNAHLDGVPFSRKTGRENVKRRLDAAGLDYTAP